MPEFYKDGKKVVCEGIYDRGQIGQCLILDNVSYDKNPDLDKKPLARYLQPSVFIITRKVEGRNGYYMLVDEQGNTVTIQDPDYGASCAYLYAASEYLTWQKAYIKEKLARKEHKIEHLEGQIALLKDILVQQGPRIVTNDEAKTLGIPR